MTTLPQTSTTRLPRSAQPRQLQHAGANGSLATGGAASAGSGAQMSLSDVWRVLRTHMWLLIFTVVISAGIGYGVNYYLAKYYSRYTATGLVQVQPPLEDPMRTGPRGGFAMLGLDVELRTQARLLTQDALISKVLTGSPEVRGTGWFKQFIVRKVQPDGSVKEETEIWRAKKDLLERFSASPYPDTTLIGVSMEYKNPKDCRVIVEEMVSQHLRDESLRGQSREDERKSVLMDMRNSASVNLNGVNQELNEKVAKLSISGLGTPGRLSAKDEQLLQLVRAELEQEMRYNEAAAAYKGITETISEGRDPQQVEEILNTDPGIVQKRSELDNLDASLVVLEQELGVENPRYKSVLLQRDVVRKQLNDAEAERRGKARAYLLDNYRAGLAVSESARSAINDKINKVKSELAELNNDMNQYLTRVDEQKALTEVIKSYQSELDKINEMTSRAQMSGVRWAAQPETPDSPSFPRLPMTMAITVMLGLGVVLGLIFLKEIMDTSIRTPGDIARVGQMTLLGIIPHEMDDPQAAGARLPLVIYETPQSMIAEQLRQVRTRLQHAAALDTTRSILVTSPSPEDGKSMIACNLAAGLALNGRRILLVDANFRRPDLHKTFGLGNEIGFGTVLANPDQFADCVRNSTVPNLDVLTSGPKPANATELLEHQLFVDFIERALQEYDHVIFDSGPLLVVSETAAMAPRVDGVVTVVRARSNSRGLLMRMRDALRQIKAEHLGVVLNAVRAQAGGYYNRNMKTYYAYQNGHAH